MFIYNQAAACKQVSSIGSLSGNSGGDEAEVGWMDLADGYNNCNTIGDNTPHVFTVWVTGSTYHCFVHGLLTANQSDNFSVWGDSSLNWTWSHAGHNVQTATLDFRLSKSATNGERHSNSDSALSMFNGMQNGTSPNWNNWSNSVCFPTQDPDPDYSNQLHSTTYIGVSTSSQQC